MRGFLERSARQSLCVLGGKYYPRLLDYAQKHSDQKMIDLLIKHVAKSSKYDG